MSRRGAACVMVGPDVKAQGGVASVIKVYADHGLFDGEAVVALASFVAGSSLRKLRVAACAWMRYACLLLRGRGAVLHVHVSSRASFWRKSLFIWTAKLARRRVVFHLHGGGFQEFIERLGAPARALALAAIRRSDRLLCLSSPVAAWLREMAPDVPVQWWPNPVPDALFVDTVVAREPLLLYLGALLPDKGVADLLDAFARMAREQGEARLVIGGAGPELAALKERVLQLGLGERVFFAGWLGSEAKADYLRRARAFVLPSRLEAQPMVLLEAMAARLPVISTAVDGVPDLLEDGVEGLLVPPGQPVRLAEAMGRLWDDETLRERLSVAARARVEARHRAGHVCAALAVLYEELAGGGVSAAKDKA